MTMEEEIAILRRQIDDLANRIRTLESRTPAMPVFVPPMPISPGPYTPSPIWTPGPCIPPYNPYHPGWPIITQCAPEVVYKSPHTVYKAPDIANPYGGHANVKSDPSNDATKINPENSVANFQSDSCTVQYVVLTGLQKC
jgi:hypothetical protein